MWQIPLLLITEQGYLAKTHTKQSNKQNQKQTFLTTKNRSCTPEETVTLLLTFAVSLPCVPVSAYNLTCPKPVNLIRTGVPACMMGGKAIPFHLQLALKACPAMPHSVSVPACFALSRGNQPALEQEDGATSSLGLQPVMKTHPTSPQKLLNVSFTSIM